jgi:lipopolysaccharide transport system ATP-binding protein
VASLLEVGTGFHPELTGRENIFLNGAILGMQREEIKRKFDEIVDFAEIEKFLDTPVKRYSSGMYVRLAFAVAAHLEPEILIVDEVLAVGDAQFQKKCLGKMDDVGREGRTVLFVSHNMAAVMNLCNRGFMLHRGVVAADTNSEIAISQYYETIQSGVDVNNSAFIRNGLAKLNVRTFDNIGHLKDSFFIGQEIIFLSKLIVDNPLKAVAFGIGIVTITGERILTFHTKYQYNKKIDLNSEMEIKFIWPHNILCPGSYRLVAALYEGDTIVSSWEDVARFTVAASDYFETGKLPDSSHQGHVLNHVLIEIEQR